MPSVYYINGEKRLDYGDEALPTNTWIFVSVIFFLDTMPTSTGDIRDKFLAKGFQAFAPDTGILGTLVPTSDWADLREGGMITVLVNVGDRDVDIGDFFALFPKTWNIDIAAWTNDFVQAHQSAIKAWAAGHDTESNAIDYSKFLNELLRYGKYVIIGGGVLAGALVVANYWPRSRRRTR